MSNLPTSTLYGFVDERSEALICVTSGTQYLNQIAQSEYYPIAINSRVMIFDREYVVKDILIDRHNTPQVFDPSTSSFNGIALGDSIQYNVWVRVLVGEL